MCSSSRRSLTEIPATVNRNGTAYENFYKRLVAFIIGGLVALIIEIVVYPVRARDRLVESLSACVKSVSNMQAAVAVGVDDPIKVNLQGHQLHQRFNDAREKAQACLGAAETFLPFCLSEPRMKGSFKRLAPIYREIIYVLHQIIDRMDNVFQLRKACGSSVLEDLNPKVFNYRRNVAASTSLALFSVNEALTTRLPLPQFLPSSRLAQLRLINRVREVLEAQGGDATGNRTMETLMKATNAHDDGKGPELDEKTAKLVTQHRFLSWNASTAGQMEIIEYLEELVELAKLLVGVNAFRSGMLERPNFRQYMRRVKTREMPFGKAGPLASASLATEDSALPENRGVEELPTQVPPRSATLPERSAARGPTPGIKRSVTFGVKVKERIDEMRGKGGIGEGDGLPRGGIPRTERGAEEGAAGVGGHGSGDESSCSESGSESDSDDGAENLPMSLQRVSTRLWEDNAAATRRRRGFTFDDSTERGRQARE